MNLYSATGLLLGVSMALIACKIGPTSLGTGHGHLEKNAQSDELRNETRDIEKLPDGCPILPSPLPAGKNLVTLSYQEPETNQNGVRLTDLLYTTIYLGSLEKAQAIHVWTNNPRGGAFVIIRDFAVLPEMKLCVTATNWARVESVPTPLTQPKP